MTLESLDNYFGSKRAKQTIQKAQQAHQVAAQISALTAIDVRVFLRKTGVVIKCPDQASAARLELERIKIEQIVLAVLGNKSKVRFTAEQE